ncbi:type II toxin-antitoxin system VapC family toxin [Jiella marina]|uniref:type II toxin-antitoxin system VapC family toxin n=1 Tax=Jiella sp. LLJ827 TaxID=2917712 RepID=UPI002101273D|nr:type II toxin-antitoxin system VapC family toxin [Jiella sp. LLJ827]MCQ0986913.1 type II toxin-antitoxin system VapC family toxin [Jiella sp. LLJ827]
MTVVLDSSAVLALIFGEPGSKIVEAALKDAAILTVNVSEAIAKLTDRGFESTAAEDAITRLPLLVVSFDLELALLAASFRPVTRRHQFSFADRACLALARRQGCATLTADRAWLKVDLGVAIELIR